ncbi:hypothetical protein DVH24_003102 [Malus domestica]|uniref:Uncharacterized protein n=1 Tax=Malus domestica TaxID=3750 RepID=A0A498K9L7_MALDO|nr:hypothetical protein DVH24_003102 [Malus domestica]
MQLQMHVFSKQPFGQNPEEKCTTTAESNAILGRPRKTLEETLRKDLEYLDLTEDMTQNQAQWRSRIHIADPT